MMMSWRLPSSATAGLFRCVTGSGLVPDVRPVAVMPGFLWFNTSGTRSQLLIIHRPNLHHGPWCGPGGRPSRPRVGNRPPWRPLLPSAKQEERLRMALETAAQTGNPQIRSADFFHGDLKLTAVHRQDERICTPGKDLIQQDPVDVQPSLCFRSTAAGRGWPPGSEVILLPAGSLIG